MVPFRVRQRHYAGHGPGTVKLFWDMWEKKYEGILSSSTIRQVQPLDEDALDRIDDAADRIEQALTRVEKAIQDRWSTSKLLAVAFLVFLLWSLFIDFLQAKWLYAAFYGVHSSDVYVQNCPHDCAFFAASLGAKYCRYERTVSVIRWATSTEGKPIISYDNGKTWGNFELSATEVVPHGSTVKAVYIGWEKKED